VGGPYSAYWGWERAKVRFRGAQPELDLHTDWDDAAEYAWFFCYRGWDPAKVDGTPVWLRRRYRAFAAEWGK
jgi:hypothetical protein